MRTDFDTLHVERIDEHRIEAQQSQLKDRKEPDGACPDDGDIVRTNERKRL